MLTSGPDIETGKTWIPEVFLVLFVWKRVISARKEDITITHPHCLTVAVSPRTTSQLDTSFIKRKFTFDGFWLSVSLRYVAFTYSSLMQSIVSPRLQNVIML